MKLNSLTINGNGYKNLKGTYSFQNSNGYIALIGLNGSGKSNLLEAISIAFANTKDIDVEQNFTYSLSYEMSEELVEISETSKYGNGTIDGRHIPSSIIACYSGEDNRLWNSGFKKYYVAFFNKAIHGGEYKPWLLCINKYCWKIAFLSLLFSENTDVISFLRDKLHIDDFDTINVKFTPNNNVKPINHEASNWYMRIKEKYAEAFISIHDLKGEDLMCNQYTELTPDQVIFYYLYFLHMPDKRGTLDLEADKLIDSIDISLNGYSFNDLSEGEKKLILIECITKVLGDEQSLVLLDEPDAHTHIAMKKDLLKLISEFKGQTIMTTHSPMFLNKRWNGYNENNVFYMNEGKIEDTQPLKYMANLTDNEVDYFEGAFILSSKKILVVEGKYDDKYLKKAIAVFSEKNSKYNKLNDIAIFSMNGASSAEVIYNQIFSECINRIDKLVFLFDYDDGGLKEGWKKIETISNSEPKVKPIFYQDAYPSKNYPTSQHDIELANGKYSIKADKSYMVEDIFPENCYLSVIDPVIKARTAKDFRQIPQAKNGTVGKIKTYIENNYNTFSDDKYENFKAVLDELLNVFNLN